MIPLVDRVREALRNAKMNDYDMSEHTDEDLAGDLIAYDADVEEETFEDVLAAVKLVRYGPDDTSGS